MKLAFDSWHAFFAMGGYGNYVWPSLGLSLLLLLGLLLSIIFNRNTLLRNIHRQQQRERRRMSARRSEAES
ncbi:heme exporter protein CcmD [Scandinavium sp. NPDC088450]|uniref:heme exporter protein CcmD n=1 Tax=Scandinavium sp. NPDC088450 TaxID=3364514 RepID=UPI00384BE41B